MLWGIPVQLWVVLGMSISAAPFIVALLRGNLIPKSTVDKLVDNQAKDYDEKVALIEKLTEERVASWKQLYEKQLEVTETTSKVADEALFVSNQSLQSSKVVLKTIQEMRAIGGPT